MKKSIAIVLILCIISMFSAAGAEESDGKTPLDRPGFILNLKSYMIYDESDGNLQVFPRASMHDYGTNVYFYRDSEAYDMTLEKLQSSMENVKRRIILQAELAGMEVISFNAEEPYETTLANEPCTAFDYSMRVSSENGVVTGHLKRLYVYNRGYIIEFTSEWDRTTNSCFEEMDQMLTWK